MKYERYLFKKVLSSLDSGKALMIVGPRRVGKTVLLKLLKKSTGREIYLLTVKILQRFLCSQEKRFYNTNNCWGPRGYS